MALSLVSDNGFIGILDWLRTRSDIVYPIIKFGDYYTALIFSKNTCSFTETVKEEADIIKFCQFKGHQRIIRMVADSGETVIVKTDPIREKPIVDIEVYDPIAGLIFKRNNITITDKYVNNQQQ